MVNKTDAIEIRIKSYSTVCSTCITQAMNGAAQHPTCGLLRDGWMHALDPDKRRTLCGIECSLDEDKQR